MKSTGEESQDGKHVVVADEGGCHTDDDHPPFTDEKGSLAAEVVRHRRKDDCTEHHADDHDGLRHLDEVTALTDEVPLWENGDSVSVGIVLE